ncbi:MAG: radical SAM protein, partial [Planctomycetia bacterium]|nr:radical SAM protein [Planctomycetia bacterium]
MKTARLARIWLTRSFRPFQFVPANDEPPTSDDSATPGLYIHIPFCRTLCEFCPYCKTVYQSESADHYGDALIRELDQVGVRNGGKRNATSLYFGGGTPVLMLDRFPEILAAVHRNYTLTDGIGTELHPDDLCEETLVRLRDSGVTKLSIGVQSFRRELLDRLGRRSMPVDAMARALNHTPFESVSFDLIFAIPGQTADMLCEDIDRALDLGANQIAVYPLIHFSFTGTGQNPSIPPVPEHLRRKLLSTVTEHSQRRGLVRTSLWTFARPDVPRYSSMVRENYLGFGTSAATLTRDRFRINTFSVEEYIARLKEDRSPGSLELRFTPRQRMVYWLFWEAYTTRVRPDAFERFFGVPLWRTWKTKLILGRLAGF